jgi:hypothetical protein
MSNATPRRAAGSVLSAHRTSQGVLRYRSWPGRISLELLREEPAAIVATVPAADPAQPPLTSAQRPPSDDHDSARIGTARGP